MSFAVGYGFLAANLQLPPYSQLKSMADSRTGQMLLSTIRDWSPSGGNPRGAPAGRWRQARQSDTESISEEQLANLEALGYLSGTRAAPALIGVTRHDPERSFQGLNLYNSGHAQMAVLMDMEGRPVHKWQFDFMRVTDPELVQERDGTLARLEGNFWRRVHLLDDGYLLAIFDGLGLIKIDSRSRLIWNSSLPVHHDLWVNDKGEIFTLARQERISKRFSALKPILDDRIVRLSEAGEILLEVSILDAFENSSYHHLLNFSLDEYDIFHTNTIEILDGSLAMQSPAFRAGNVLVSMRHLDTVAVVDLDLKSVVWALSGLWHWQHEPTVLDSGNLLVFNNLATETWSEVVEIDPFSQDVVWAYSGSDQGDFLSQTCGTAQRLLNGNTLITESDAGRAFEVTQEGEIVWEFFNPARAGNEDELIAVLFELRRLENSAQLDWLPPDSLQ